MNELRDAIRLVLSTRLSNRAIAEPGHFSYNTIGRFRRVAKEKGYELVDLLQLSDEELQAKFYEGKPRGKAKRMPDWAHVHGQLQGVGVTRSLLWLEYFEEEPATAYMQSQFNLLYNEWAGKQAVSMRQQHVPGERAFVDFSGTRMSWIDPTTGAKHVAEIFIASTGVSGYLFARAVPSQRQEHWISVHADLFEFLGGVPKILVPDNLKSAVLRTGGAEPILNPAYSAMADHYGAVILPARPKRPRDKPRAEGAVLIFLRWGIARLRNRVFHSLAELNTAIAECVTVINDREMRLFKQSRRARFELIDKPELLQLASRYDYGEWFGPMRVPPDYHVNINGHFYSVPYRLVQQKIHARCTVNTVEILVDRKRVASHARSDLVGQQTTDRSHMPEQHLAWADHTPERYVTWSESVGPNAHAVIAKLFEDAKHPAEALNRCAAMQKIAKAHGSVRFELACARALSINSPTAKSIRSILQSRLEDQNGTAPQGRLPLHGNLRGAQYYRDEETAHAE